MGGMNLSRSKEEIIMKDLADPWLNVDISPIESLIDAKKAIYKEFIENMGMMPVSIIEPFKPSDKEKIEKNLLPLLPNPILRCRKSSKRKKAYELFYGKNSDAVREAVQLTDLIESAVLSHANFIKTICRLGELLGYPSCCSSAFAHESPKIRTVSEWLHVSRRISYEGEIPWELNPYTSIIDYIPCSLNCENTLKIVRNALKLHESRHGISRTDSLKRMCLNPFLFLLDKPFQFIELKPLEEPSEHFHYNGGFVYANDKRILKVREGDAIRIKNGNIKIYKNNKVIEKFIQTAFCWWYKKSFHPDFWRIWIKQNFISQEIVGLDNKKRKRTWYSKQSEELKKKLEELLQSSDRKFASFTLISIEPTFESHVFLTFQDEKNRIILKIELKNNIEKAFLWTKKYALSYRNETPLDTKEKEEAVRTFAEFLDQNS